MMGTSSSRCRGGATGLPRQRAGGQAVLLAALLTLAGCGAKPEPPAPATGGAVSGSVDMERPTGAGADAGTAGGHRQPAGVASTRGSAYVIRGTVRPPGARVSILNRDTRERATAEVSSSGDFRARAAGLRRGVNRVAVTGRRSGLARWSVEVTVTRER